MVLHLRGNKSSLPMLTEPLLTTWCGKVMNKMANNEDPGGRLNKKDGLTRYGDSHVKDKTS